MDDFSNLVDSHCHLDLLEDPLTAISESRLAGVGHMITVGIDLESSKKAVEAAITQDGVYAAIGIHPNDSSGVSDSHLDELAGLAASREGGHGRGGQAGYHQDSDGNSGGHG